MATGGSAGGIVVNARGEVAVVTQRDGTWSLPKGHIDPGETALAAAIREIREETGLTQLVCLASLGAHERSARHEPSGTKTVHLFLFVTRSEHLQPTDPHNQIARWVAFDDAVRLISNRGDAVRLAQARARVERARQYLDRGRDTGLAV